METCVMRSTVFGERPSPRILRNRKIGSLQSNKRTKPSASIEPDLLNVRSHSRIRFCWRQDVAHPGHPHGAGEAAPDPTQQLGSSRASFCRRLPRASNRAKTDDFAPFFGPFMPRGGKLSTK